ncbi:conjugal transfer protein TraX [Streptococcus gallolyticus]|nr:conjugal transfer protein TraX [Streptococcus gallolyticus]MBY5040478.1 conjugal transfer protein TraX [Streptococcus gallolyticus]
MQKTPSLSSFFLRNLAMILMLIDHTGLVFFPNHIWIRAIGRLAFPIFAFLLVQGFLYTHDLRSYIGRLLAMAILTDIPYHLMSEGKLAYSPFQNVLWTFVIALISLASIDYLKKLEKKWALLPILLVLLIACSLADYLGTDYASRGVAMVHVFYFFQGQSLKNKSWQLFFFFIINVIMKNFPLIQEYGWEAVYQAWQIYGLEIISIQYWALTALPIIWLYSGQQGYKSKISQSFSYLFYPLHMLLLALIKVL